MIQYQILLTNITRTVWQTVRRITNEILGVKGLTWLTLNSHEWPRQNFSLQYQYNIRGTSDENKEKYQLRGYELIQCQILWTSTIRISWQKVWRITNEILGVKGFNHCFNPQIWFLVIPLPVYKCALPFILSPNTLLRIKTICHHKQCFSVSIPHLLVL